MTGAMPIPSDTTHTNVNARAFASDRPACTRSRQRVFDRPDTERIAILVLHLVDAAEFKTCLSRRRGTVESTCEIDLNLSLDMEAQFSVHLAFHRTPPEQRAEPQKRIGEHGLHWGFEDFADDGGQCAPCLGLRAELCAAAFREFSRTWRVDCCLSVPQCDLIHHAVPADARPDRAIPA